MSFLDSAMSDLEEQFLEWRIELGEYTERVVYLETFLATWGTRKMISKELSAVR